jgi:hypothetical protein
MAFKPNYRFKRNERNLAKQTKKEEKLRRRGAQITARCGGRAGARCQPATGALKACAYPLGSSSLCRQFNTPGQALVLTWPHPADDL